MLLLGRALQKAVGSSTGLLLAFEGLAFIGYTSTMVTTGHALVLWQAKSPVWFLRACFVEADGHAEIIFLDFTVV